MQPSSRSTPEAIRAAYDLAAQPYADKFLHELDHKPLDRELLQRFVSKVERSTPALDLGCGPGHTTAYLTSLGLEATGVDLAPKMVDLATTTFPRARFILGDFCALPHETGSIGGLLAFYCLVHLQPADLPTAFAEMSRVLRPRGVFLLSFHVGTEVIRAENFLGTGATLDFTFFEPQQVREALIESGFERIEVIIREPYEIEYPSQRCYVFAYKPALAG